MFKLLELFDGKITLDANTLDFDTVQYLMEFKDNLNKYIEEENKKRQKERDAEMRRLNASAKGGKGNRASVDDLESVFQYSKGMFQGIKNK